MTLIIQIVEVLIDVYLGSENSIYNLR